jgi:hypothetical protein
LTVNRPAFGYILNLLCVFLLFKFYLSFNLNTCTCFALTGSLITVVNLLIISEIKMYRKLANCLTIFVGFFMHILVIIHYGSTRVDQRVEAHMFSLDFNHFQKIISLPKILTHLWQPLSRPSRPTTMVPPPLRLTTTPALTTYAMLACRPEWAATPAIPNS